MRCEPCNDTCVIALPEPRPVAIEGGGVIMVDRVPCPECFGLRGSVSCCEGFGRDAGIAGVDAPARGGAHG